MDFLREKKHATDNMQSWPPESLTNLEKERSETAQKGSQVLQFWGQDKGVVLLVFRQVMWIENRTVLWANIEIE